MDLVTTWQFLVQPAVYWTVAILTVVINFYVMGREYVHQKVAEEYPDFRKVWVSISVFIVLILACGWPGGIPIALGILLFRVGLRHGESNREYRRKLAGLQHENATIKAANQQLTIERDNARNEHASLASKIVADYLPRS